MAITVSTLLDRAVRMLGELQANQTLDADTLTLLGAHAMEWLNGLAAHVTGTGELLFPLTLDADYTLPAGNVMVRCSADATLKLPVSPSDGWRVVVAYVASGATLTIDPNGAKANGAASNVTVNAGSVDDFFYRADLANWGDSRVTATSDNVPYPDDVLRGLEAMLALEIQPILGLPVEFDTRQAAAAGERAMVSRYFRKHPDLFKAWRYQSSPRAASPGA